MTKPNTFSVGDLVYFDHVPLMEYAIILKINDNDVVIAEFLNTKITDRDSILHKFCIPLLAGLIEHMYVKM